jgi:hypothetical protein
MNRRSGAPVNGGELGTCSLSYLETQIEISMRPVMAVTWTLRPLVFRTKRDPRLPLNQCPEGQETPGRTNPYGTLWKLIGEISRNLPQNYIYVGSTLEWISGIRSLGAENKRRPLSTAARPGALGLSAILIGLEGRRGRGAR